MSFWENLRFQFAAETESDAVGRMRFYAAALNWVGGLYGAALVFLMSIGELSWLATPGCALLLAGGVLGIAIQVGRDVHVARRRLWWAWGCTILGALLFAAVA